MEGRKYFISYARNDSEFVLKLATELRGRGPICGWINSISSEGSAGTTPLNNRCRHARGLS